MLKKFVKEFVKSNKKEILIGTGLLVGTGVLGYKIGKYKFYNTPINFEDMMPKGFEHLGTVLDSLENGGVYGSYGAVVTPGFDPSELGELGADIIKRADKGKIDGMKFTHFIVLGR